jgi:sulfur-oxidizing protein SoxX
MTKNSKRLIPMAVMAMLLAGQLQVGSVGAAEGIDAVAEGKAIAFARSKGNCLACHMIQGGESPGNVGPPLIAMKARYPEKEVLRAQIYDATAFNPDSAMVPFGKNRVLTEDEINKVTEYIWTL